MSYTKFSDKLYAVPLEDGTALQIKVSLAKQEAVFNAFLTYGGFISDDGNAVNDAITIMKTLRPVCNAVLTEYTDKGEVEKEGNVEIYSARELGTIYGLSMDVVQNFFQPLFEALNESPTQAKSGEQTEDKKPKKTK